MESEQPQPTPTKTTPAPSNDQPKPTVNSLPITGRLIAGAAWLWALLVRGWSWFQTAFTFRTKMVVLIVVFIPVVGLLVNRLNLFHYLAYKSVDSKPGTKIEDGPSGLLTTGKDGLPKKTWHNPSANLELDPVTDPATGKPSLDPKIQFLGLRLVPRFHTFWDFHDSRSDWAVGSQVVWFDAYGVGPSLNERMVGGVIDRRFKVPEIENLALAGGMFFTYDDVAKLKFDPHFEIGLSFFLGR